MVAVVTLLRVLARKRGSRRHSTTSFSENVNGETNYQMLEVLSFAGGCNLLH